MIMHYVVAKFDLEPMSMIHAHDTKLGVAFGPHTLLRIFPNRRA